MAANTFSQSLIKKGFSSVEEIKTNVNFSHENSNLANGQVWLKDRQARMVVGLSIYDERPVEYDWFHPDFVAGYTALFQILQNVASQSDDPTVVTETSFCYNSTKWMRASHFHVKGFFGNKKAFNSFCEVANINAKWNKPHIRRSYIGRWKKDKRRLAASFRNACPGSQDELADGVLWDSSGKTGPFVVCQNMSTLEELAESVTLMKRVLANLEWDEYILAVTVETEDVIGTPIHEWNLSVVAYIGEEQFAKQITGDVDAFNRKWLYQDTKKRVYHHKGKRK